MIFRALPIGEGTLLKLLPGEKQRESVVSISAPRMLGEGIDRWLVLPDFESCAVVSGLMVSRRLSVLVGESRMVLQ